MKCVKTIMMGICVAAVVGCNTNRPKYESVLEEMSEVMASIDSEEDDEQVRIIDRNEGLKVLNEYVYQQDFEQAPVPKDLWEYLWLPDKSIKFNNYDDSFICEINSEMLSPAVHALLAYDEYGGQYPAEMVMELLTELQGQYARSLNYSWTVSLPMAILFNRFTQQALRLCPDISLLTDQYTNFQDVAVINLPRRYVDRATTILVFKDSDGIFRTKFADNLQVDRVAKIGLSGDSHYVFYTECTDPEQFQMYVMKKDYDDNVDFPLQYVEQKDVLYRWLSTGVDMKDAYLQWYWSAKVDLVFGPKASQTVRTLHFVKNDDGTLTLEYDPDRDEKTGLNGYYRDSHILAFGDREKMVDRLGWAGSEEWEKVFPVTDAAMRRALEEEALGFSNDGNLMAIDLKDKNESVRILDLRTRAFRPFTIVGDGSSIESIQFSPDDSKILVQSWAGRVKIVDARTGEVFNAYKMNDREIDVPLVFDWDSLCGYTSYGGNLIKVDVAGGMEAVVDTIGCNNHIEPCGEDILICLDEDPVFFRYNPRERQIVRKYHGHTSLFPYAAASQDGKRIVSTALDGTIRLWDAESGKQLWMTDGEVGVHFGKVGFSPDGKSITYVLPTEYRATSIQLPF